MGGPGEERSRVDAHAEAEAAFLEHGEISEDVAEFEKWLDGGGDKESTWALRLGEHLAPLCNTLKSHFAAEESSGLYRKVPVEAGDYSDVIERLFDEHYDMIREIESLIQSAHAITGSTFEGDRKALTQRARGIIFALRRHEAEENEILHRIYWGDPEGGGN